VVSLQISMTMKLESMMNDVLIVYDDDGGNYDFDHFHFLLLLDQHHHHHDHQIDFDVVDVVLHLLLVHRHLENDHLKNELKKSNKIFLLIFTS
jgi:hypothetical protein